MRHKIINGEIIPLTAEEIAAEEAQAIIVQARMGQDAIRAEIARLESEITPRRIREALLGDTAWLEAQEDLINQQRSKL